MKKSLLIGLSTTAVTLSLVGLASMASAQSTTTSTSLVDKIATKFNLNKSDVKAVFEEDRAAHEAERAAEMSTRLQSLVDKGTITADQKAKIEAKQKELQTTRDTKRTELEKWASDNGIDMKYVHAGRGHGPMGEDSATTLQSLVDKGTITADQKAKIEAKQSELESQRTAERTAQEQWAKDNGIDMSYLMGGKMDGRGHGGPGMM